MRKIIALILLLMPATSYGWTVTSTFEDGTPGTVANSINGFPIAGARTTYSDTRAHSGSMSTKMQWVLGDEGWMQCHGEYVIDPVGTDGIWIRGYFYFPAGFDFTVTNNTVNKLIRIRAPQTMMSVFTNAGTSSTVGKLVSSNEPADYQSDLTSTNITSGSWHSVEQYVKFGNPGIHRIWFDGVLQFSDTTRNTGTAGNSIYFLTNWNMGSPANQDMWIDDIVITTDIPAGRDAADNPMIGLTDQPPPADTVQPVTTASPIAGTYTSARSVSLSCSDAFGCTSTQYCIGASCTPSTNYSAPISIGATSTLRYRSNDAANNLETIKQSVYMIDPEAVVDPGVASISASFNASFR